MLFVGYLDGIMSKHAVPKASDHKLLALGIFLAKIIAHIPLPILLFFGKIVGVASYYIAKSRRKIIHRNLELCFPDLDAKSRKKLIKDNFKSMGMAIFEVIIAWYTPQKKLEKYFVYEGLENLKAYEESEKGALLLTLHMTPLELGGRAISLKTKVRGMYRPHDNPYYEYIQYKGRYEQSGLEPITRDETRRMIKLLRSGDLIWYAPDQNYGSTDHVFIPFFGVNALTITATSTLCRLGKAGALPYYVIRKGSKYHIKIMPMMENFPTDDLKADTIHINEMFEKWIMEAPEQYLWAHRRFKTRPKGETDLYQDL